MEEVFFALAHDVSSGQAAHAANRPIVLLAVLLWPMSLALLQTVGSRGVWLFVLLTLASTFTTESQSAQLAMLGAVFAFDFMSAEGPAFSLPLTVASRLELWSFVAGKIMEQPLFGYGLEAGRFLPLEGMAHMYFGGPLMHHPHNAILQIWFEMGGLGAVVAALGWALLVRQIGGLTARYQAYLLAALTCILIVGTVSHGLWQTWWVSGLVVVPVFFAISLRDGARSEGRREV